MTQRRTNRPKIAEFENSLSELEELVTRLEQGGQSIDNSLKDFERGVELTRKCQLTLDFAEQRIETLVDGEAGEEKKEKIDKHKRESEAEGE